MLKFGKGSFYNPDVLSSTEINTLNRLADSKYVPRDALGMKMRDNELRRSKRFFVAGNQPLITPPPVTGKTLKRPRESVAGKEMVERYYYTGWTWASMLHYERIQNEPLILEITLKMCALYKTDFNHVILTRYRRDPTSKRDDSIGFHYDKPQDLDSDAPIVVLTLGDDLREFVVRERFPFFSDGSLETKQPLKPKEQKLWNARKRELLRVAPQPGSIIYMTAQDNLEMEHAVVPTKEEKLLKPRPVKGYRMSLVFRKSKVLVSQSQIDKATVRFRETVAKRKLARKDWVCLPGQNLVHNRATCLELSKAELATGVIVRNGKGKRFCSCIAQ